MCKLFYGIEWTKLFIWMLLINRWKNQITENTLLSEILDSPILVLGQFSTDNVKLQSVQRQILWLPLTFTYFFKWTWWMTSYISYTQIFLYLLYTSFWSKLLNGFIFHYRNIHSLFSGSLLFVTPYLLQIELFFSRTAIKFFILLFRLQLFSKLGKRYLLSNSFLIYFPEPCPFSFPHVV